MKYTVFDVETANSQRDSICAIVIIRYENDEVVFEKEILITFLIQGSFHAFLKHSRTDTDIAVQIIAAYASHLE